MHFRNENNLYFCIVSLQVVCSLNRDASYFQDDRAPLAASLWNAIMMCSNIGKFYWIFIITLKRYTGDMYICETEIKFKRLARSILFPSKIPQKSGHFTYTIGWMRNTLFSAWVLNAIREVLKKCYFCQWISNYFALT